LIQHDSTMQARRGWTPPEGHPLKVNCITTAVVAVADLDAAVDDYRRLLGSPPEGVEQLDEDRARRARFRLWNFRLELLQPQTTEGDLFNFIRDRGEGLFRLALAVPNIDAAVRLLRERGTAVSDPTPERAARLLDPSQTLDARFSLVEGK
jgi:catechol 2,3-dioxygenase-like lactoylglutathione lyase family enzyme